MCYSTSKTLKMGIMVLFTHTKNEISLQKKNHKTKEKAIP